MDSGIPTSQVRKIKTVGEDFDVTYYYTYDANGNILTVSDATNITSYVYDSANQLIRENNEAEGKTWTYAYDDGGNITEKKEYAFTTGTLGTVLKTDTYGYSITSWGDLLVSINGQTVTNDDAGNPLSDGTWTYTWEHGRELMSMTSADKTVTYTYNADGLRVSKTVDGVVHEYVYCGDKLIQETYGTTKLEFSYDAYGNPYTLKYTKGSDTPLIYHYVVNLQGDVIRIVNSSGVTRVTYSYDAWGNIIDMTYTSKALADANPLRYRGYYYDRDTDLYYLQSRYYNPKTGRFLNADAYASTGQGLLGNNMFAYCANNPIAYHDYTGMLPTNNQIQSQFMTESGYGWVERYVTIPKKELFSGTISTGGVGAAYAGGGAEASVGFVIDGKGNAGLVETLGVGAGTPSAGGGIYISYSTAPTIDKLAGTAYYVGGSIDILGISLGMETSIFNDNIDPGITYVSYSFAISFGAPIPLEEHGGVSYSWVQFLWDNQ